MKVLSVNLKKVLKACSIENNLYTTARIRCNKKDGQFILERYDGVVTLKAWLLVEGDMGTDSVLEVDWGEFLKTCSLNYEELDIQYADQKLKISFQDIVLVELPILKELEDFKAVDLGEVVTEEEFGKEEKGIFDLVKSIVDVSMIVPPEFHNIKIIDMGKEIGVCGSNVVSLYLNKGISKSQGEISINKNVVEVISYMLEVGTVSMYVMNTGMGYCEVSAEAVLIRIFFSFPAKGLPDVVGTANKEMKKVLKGKAIIPIDEFKKYLIDMFALISEKGFNGVVFDFKKGVLEMKYTGKVTMRVKIKGVEVSNAFSAILDINLLKAFVDKSSEDIQVEKHEGSEVVILKSNAGILGVAECQKL